MEYHNGTAAEITKKSKSNLAFALACVPKERREALVVFYAYCRIIDDIADSEELTPSEKATRFNHWKDGLQNGFTNPTIVERETLEIRDQYKIPTQYFLELIEGCEMDLHPQTYGSWDDLQRYTYRVACAVGIVSLYLFGADPARSKQYALDLGHALQLTNILRDVGEDLDNGGRIYLPLEDFKQFDYTEADLRNKVYDERFRAMMQFQTTRAHSLYQKAQNSLPQEDEKALKAAKVMGTIYKALLEKIEKEEFNVLNQRLSVSKPRKVFLLLSAIIFQK